jgi:hypothetical protein
MRSLELSATVTGKGSVSAGGSVECGVNEGRMTDFGLIFATAVGAGITVGFAFSSVLLGVPATVGAALATALLLAAIYRVRVVRHAVMEVMHRITG